MTIVAARQNFCYNLLTSGRSNLMHCSPKKMGCLENVVGIDGAVQ